MNCRRKGSTDTGSLFIQIIVWQTFVTKPFPEQIMTHTQFTYDDVIKWKHFPRYWPFVWGIHRSPVNSPHKGQWRGALMLSLICVWINGWVYNREAGDLWRHRTHYDVRVMKTGERGVCALVCACWYLLGFFSCHQMAFANQVVQLSFMGTRPFKGFEWLDLRIGHWGGSSSNGCQVDVHLWNFSHSIG